MRFFSKITFIWNICFVAFVILRRIEQARDIAGNKEAIIPLPALQGTLVILGITAVFINAVFILSCIIVRLFQPQISVAAWMVWVNLLLLVLQIVYFILY